MKTKAITNFAQQLGVQIAFNPDYIIEKGGRFYLIDNKLKPAILFNFYYVGLYLGKIKKGKFFPSFNLLSMMAKENGNKVLIDKKSAWLFICGRDVLRKSIIELHGFAKKNSYVLILNEFSECLGFGRIVGKLSGECRSDDVVIKNVSDVGDFLRRERY